MRFLSVFFELVGRWGQIIRWWGVKLWRRINGCRSENRCRRVNRRGGQDWLHRRLPVALAKIATVLNLPRFGPWHLKVERPRAVHSLVKIDRGIRVEPFGPIALLIDPTGPAQSGPSDAAGTPHCGGHCTGDHHNMQHAKIHRRLGPADGKKVVAKTGQILAKCAH